MLAVVLTVPPTVSAGAPKSLNGEIPLLCPEREKIPTLVSTYLAFPLVLFPPV